MSSTDPSPHAIIGTAVINKQRERVQQERRKESKTDAGYGTELERFGERFSAQTHCGSHMFI
jgi:hypothetical protein